MVDSEHQIGTDADPYLLTAQALQQIGHSLAKIADEMVTMGKDLERLARLNLVDAPETPTGILRRPNEATVRFIFEHVAEAYDVTVTQITMGSRRVQIVRARQMAMYILRCHTDLSLTGVAGKFFSTHPGRPDQPYDHTTVRHGVQAVTRALRANTADGATTRRTYQIILSRLRKHLDIPPVLPNT